MTNFERWQYYCKDLTSPQSFIDWGYYFLVGAFLQRRVWISSGHRSVYPNKYVIPTGPAAVGKGLIIKPVSEFLRHWKLKDRLVLDKQLLEQDEKDTLDLIIDKDSKSSHANNGNGETKKSALEPLLIPVGANSTTFESLVREIGQSLRHIPYIIRDHETDKRVVRNYAHSSMALCLPELASLFKKKSENIITLILELYDCPEVHEYKTKNSGEDIVKRGCLNMLAGTTPHYIEEMFDEGIVTEGFSSRVFFIYATEPRDVKFFLPPETQSQIDCKNELLKHFLKLTTLYGSINVPQATADWLQDWFVKYSKDKSKRANSSRMMEDYYGRKNLHVMKMAMALHFSESYEMEIPLETYQKAIEILDAEEKNMDRALVIKAKNPVSNLARKILEYCSKDWKESTEIKVDLFDFATSPDELDEAISYLLGTGQLEQDTKKDKQDDMIVLYRKKKI